MKPLATLAFVLAPGLAVAHEGAHMHPHGIGFGIAALLASLAVGGAVGAAGMAKVRR